MDASALLESVARLPTWFPQEGRLAHLLLTSKSEGPLRDALCWDLQQQLGDEVLAVREWRRVDLAVFSSEGWEPALLVEAKLMYGFDGAVVGRRGVDYVKKVAADLHKLEQFDAQAAALAFVVNPMGLIPTGVPSISKYAGGHNRGIKQAGDAVRLRETARLRLRRALRTFGEVNMVNLDAGAWRHGEYEVEVQLDAWLIQPA